MIGRPLRRLLVNYHHALDAVMFYLLLFAALSVVVYGFAPAAMRQIFSHYVPPAIAFCLITQTLLGLEPPAVVRPLLHQLIRVGDEVMYRWNSAPDYNPGRRLEPRYGRVVSIALEDVPENYRQAFKGRHKTYVASIRTGTFEQKVPVEFVFLC